jgi:excisionase family DNA binding protein
MSSKKSSASPSIDVISISEPLLVPLRDAARLLGVEIYSIRKLARRGVLPYRKIGNKWLVPFAALRDFANGVPAPKRQGARA